MKKISILNLSPTQHLSEIYHGFLNTHVPGYVVTPYQPEKKAGTVDALIVIGANSDPGKLEKIDIPEERVFVYNLEHLVETSPWLKTRYANVLSKYNLIDFSKNNESFYAKYCKKINYLPVPMFDSFFGVGSKDELELVNVPVQKAYDVLMFGAESPRRRMLHNKLLAAGITSVYVTNLWGPSRLKALRQARTVLNVHISSKFALETTRLNWVLANGVPVVSEHSPHDPMSSLYQEAVELLPFDQIVEYYESNIGRIRSSRFGLFDIKSTKLYNNLEPTRQLEALYARLTYKTSGKVSRVGRTNDDKLKPLNAAELQHLSSALLFGRYHSSDFRGSPTEKLIKELESIDPLCAGFDLSRASQIAAIKRLLSKSDLVKLVSPIVARIVFSGGLAASLDSEALVAIRSGIESGAPGDVRELALTTYFLSIGDLNYGFSLLRKTSNHYKAPDFISGSTIAGIKSMSWESFEQAVCGFQMGGFESPVHDESWNGVLLALIEKARSFGLHACAYSLKKLISSYVGLSGAQAGLLAAVAYEVGNGFEAKALALRAKVEGFSPPGISNLISASSASISFSLADGKAMRAVSSAEKVLEDLLKYTKASDTLTAHRIFSNSELGRLNGTASLWRKIYFDGKDALCVSDEWFKTVQGSGAICLLGHYNESDIVEWSINTLSRQGFDVIVVDNWSETTHSEKLEGLQQKYGFNTVRFPEAPSAAYEWGALLKYKEEIASQYSDSWVVHQDADEIRLSSCPDFTFKEMMNYARAVGFNAIDHIVMNIRPLDDSYSSEKHPFAVYTAFQFGSSDTDLQVKAWVQGKNKADLSSSGGHLVDFVGRKIFPLRQFLFHFPLRTAAQAENKIFRERLARFKEEERSKGWHAHYDKYRSEKFKFWDRNAVLPLTDFEPISRPLIHRKNVR